MRLGRVQNFVSRTNLNIFFFKEYAFHTEPYTASQVISKTFGDTELCNLGSLQMMLPAHVYIMAQKKSPYKEFFDWRSVVWKAWGVIFGTKFLIARFERGLDGKN